MNTENLEENRIKRRSGKIISIQSSYCVHCLHKKCTYSPIKLIFVKTKIIGIMLNKGYVEESREEYLE